MNRIRHELREMAGAALFFGTWIAVLLLLKSLILAEYQIAFHHFAMAAVGALILSKVVVVLEHVPLGDHVRAAPAWVDLFLRTALYAVGVVAVLALEHGIGERHAYGGFVPAVVAGFAETDRSHVLANSIAIIGALLVYNALAIVRRHLRSGSIVDLFRVRIPEDPPPQADE